MQEKERIFLCKSLFIWYDFWSEVQREIGSGFCYLGFVITSWLKRLPLRKIWKRKKKLLSFLWDHTVFAPSDVKSRAGSITHSPYSIRPLTPRRWISQTLLPTYCRASPGSSLGSSFLCCKVPVGFGVPWPCWISFIQFILNWISCSE